MAHANRKMMALHSKESLAVTICVAIRSRFQKELNGRKKYFLSYLLRLRDTRSVSLCMFKLVYDVEVMLMVCESLCCYYLYILMLRPYLYFLFVSSRVCEVALLFVPILFIAHLMDP